MVKIGIIGLGDIANKAYLPLIGSRKIEAHLYTRSEAKLSQARDQYRFKNLHPSLGSLINSGIKGAFVHAATTAHYEIVEQLLNHNIHVYIDKPLTYDYASSEELVNLATRKNLALMVGFNRRYAPAYRRLKELPDPNMIIMQKNRKSLPGDIRTFVFDDFIHVVDTLRYMFPYPVDTITVNGRENAGLLYHVVVEFIASNGATAIGIMNRDSGTVIETLEVITPTATGIATNLTDVVMYQDKNETRLGNNDWESTLYKRGFEQITTDFLQVLESGAPPQISGTDALLTHKICEEVVERLSRM